MFGLGKTKEEKEQERQQKELEKQQKIDIKLEAKEAEELRQAEEKRKKDVKKAEEKLQKEGLANFVPSAIYTDEQVLYRFNFEAGGFRTKVVKSHSVTNYRVVTTVLQTKTNHMIMLEEISDAVPMNVHHTYSGQYHSVSAGGRGFRSHVGGRRCIYH